MIEELNYIATITLYDSSHYDYYRIELLRELNYYESTRNWTRARTGLLLKK